MTTRIKLHSRSSILTLFTISHFRKPWWATTPCTSSRGSWGIPPDSWSPLQSPRCLTRARESCTSRASAPRSRSGVVFSAELWNSETPWDWLFHFLTCTCKGRKRLGCVNPASWLSLATGHNFCMSIFKIDLKVRIWIWCISAYFLPASWVLHLGIWHTTLDPSSPRTFAVASLTRSRAKATLPRFQTPIELQKEFFLLGPFISRPTFELNTPLQIKSNRLNKINRGPHCMPCTPPWCHHCLLCSPPGSASPSSWVQFAHCSGHCTGQQCT